MELEESGYEDPDADGVQKLQDYCIVRGWPQPRIEESMDYPYIYVTQITVGGKKVFSRGQSARNARERAAFKWLKLHGQPEIRIIPDQRNSPISEKSKGARAKSSKTSNTKDVTKLQPVLTLEDGTTEDEDLDELKDPGKKTLVAKVFGNSPILRRSQFKQSKKSVRKMTKTSPQVDPEQSSSASDDEHNPPPPKKSASMKKKIFSVFKESPKIGKSEKTFKFQFKRDLGLPGFRTGEELKEQKSPSRAKTQPSSSHKVSKEEKKYERQQSSIDLEILQLLESSSDSEIPQSRDSLRLDRGGRGDELEREETSSDETVNDDDDDLFSSLKKRFGFRRKKNKIPKQSDRHLPPSASFLSEVVLEEKGEDQDHLFISTPRKEQTPAKGRKLGSPSIDELLKLPEKVGNTGKTMDEILDEVDEEIRASQANHEKEMKKLDQDLEALRARKKKRKQRLEVNALMRDKLTRGITRSVLRKMFEENLPYLKDIKSGQIVSARHTAFHTNAGTRQALFYKMITHPFSDEQVDWTYEEMTRIWMRTTKEFHDNNDYIWKVLMPECFIKFYMDFFSISREEAETRIGETALEMADSESEH